MEKRLHYQVKMTQPIPEAVSSIQLPLEKLHQLPEAVTVSHRKGRAEVSMKVAHDTIFVYAHCDSLQQRVEFYEEALSRQRSDQVSHTEDQPNYRGWILLLMVIALIGRAKRK